MYDISGREPELDVLRRMAQVIGHRGPDGEEFFIDGGLGFAHRHLRIIDLSDAAMQPMANRAGTLRLVFNGEIYNYIELRSTLESYGHLFRTKSDTEVILHAYQQWGTGCLHRFNGMLAFALWDAPRRRLFIARDRIGVKPLYYTWDGLRLIFGSEIKALLSFPGTPRTPNLSAMAEYLVDTYTTGEHTWFEGITRLLPGHSMLLSPEGLTVSEWWDLPFEREEDYGARPARYYAQQTRRLLEDSVRLRMRSDVPLGAHLSGGVDSSAVVALLSKQLAPWGEPVRTFSGAFAEGPAYDERPYIHAVSRRYGTRHSEILPDSASLPLLFDRLIWHMDEPTAGPGIILQWAVCELTKNAGVTVINGGQGGDEAWAGYFRYIPAYMHTLAQQTRRSPTLLPLLAKSAATLFSNSNMRSAMFRAASGRWKGKSKSQEGLPTWTGDLFGKCEMSQLAHKEQSADQAYSGTNLLSAKLFHDLKWYLPALLQVEDRTSMAFSLESRAPLLDYRLIEHSATVPAALKMRGLTTKYILRRAVRDLLPASVYKRRDKMGMPTPIDLWFRSDLRPWVEERLLSREALTCGLLDPAQVGHAIEEHANGKRDRSLDLWKMLNITAWWQMFMTAGYAGEFGQITRPPAATAV